MAVTVRPHRRGQGWAAAEEILQGGGQAIAVRADVTSREQIDGAIGQAIARFGRVNFLFNSAGAAVNRCKFLEIDDALLNKTLAINLHGTFYGMQAVFPHMLEHGGGVIVNVCSMTSRRGGPGASIHYAAAKGAIDSMTLGVAREFADRNIRCLSISARSDQHQLSGGIKLAARFPSPRGRRRADETPRRTRGNRRTRAVHVFRCLRVYDRQYGLRERRWRLPLAKVGSLADAQEPNAFVTQPGDGGLGMRRQLIHQRPELRAVIHVPKVSDFMRHDVVLNERGGHHEAPA